MSVWNFVFITRGLIEYAIWLAGVVAGVTALVHAVRQRADAFPAVDKQKKGTWIAILAIATIFPLLMDLGTIGNPLIWRASLNGGMLIWLIAIGAICVYLIDVRPKVDEVQRGPRW